MKSSAKGKTANRFSVLNLEDNNVIEVEKNAYPKRDGKPTIKAIESKQQGKRKKAVVVGESSVEFHLSIS